MDPYIESPAIWREFHTRLAVGIADMLQPALTPLYRVAVEQRVYIAPMDPQPDLMIADLAIRKEPSPGIQERGPAAADSRSVQVLLPVPEEVTERFLEIRSVRTHELVTIIEILSPTTKRPGKGRDVYMRKRFRVLQSLTNLVEVDLLRSGDRMPMQGQPEHYDYGVLVCRSNNLTGRLYGVTVRETLPTIIVPLLQPEHDVSLQLQSVFDQVFERARLDLEIDYSGDPIPPLDKDDAVWADTLLKEKGLR
jgi:hypothetical protein